MLFSQYILYMLRHCLYKVYLNDFSSWNDLYIFIIIVYRNLTETIKEKFWETVPTWDTASKKLRMTMAGFVFFMALCSIVLSLFPVGQAAMQVQPQYRNIGQPPSWNIFILLWSVLLLFSFYAYVKVYTLTYKLSPLGRGVLDTTLCDKVFRWLPVGWWFSPGTPVSSIKQKTDHHDIT